MDHDQLQVEEVSIGFHAFANGDFELEDSINVEYSAYKGKRGLFSQEICWRSVTRMRPHDW